MTAETGPNDTASDKEMPFLEHLIELRARILRSFALIGILFIPIYYYAGPLFSFVAAPLVQALPDGSSRRPPTDAACVRVRRRGPREDHRHGLQVLPPRVRERRSSPLPLHLSPSPLSQGA